MPSSKSLAGLNVENEAAGAPRAKRPSDGTVVFSIAPVLTGGSKKTVELAHKHRKPVIHISLDGSPFTEKAACSPERQGARMMDMNWRAIDRPGIILALAEAAQ